MAEPFKIRSIIRPVLLFCLVYFPVLVGWVYLKHFYTRPLVCSGAKLATMSLDAELHSCRYERGGVQVIFSRHVVTPLGIYPAKSAVLLSDNSYTFNLPITLAMLIVTSLLMHISWRSWSKAVVALVMGHLTYIYACFLYRLQLFRVVVNGKELVSHPPFAIQLFWDFCNSMLIRFEPFLILIVLVLLHKVSTMSARSAKEK